MEQSSKEQMGQRRNLEMEQLGRGAMGLKWGKAKSIKI
jgi:hypothetical protein